MPKLRSLLSPSKHRVLFTIAMCIGVLVLGAVVFGALASLKKPAPERVSVEKVYNVEVFDVQPTDLQEILSAFGTAASDREVPVLAQVTGQVIHVHPRLDVGETMQPTGTFSAAIGIVGENAATDALRTAGVFPGLTDHYLVRIDKSVYRARVRQARNALAEIDREESRLDQEIANNAKVLKTTAEQVAAYQEEYDRYLQLKKDGVAIDTELTKASLELKRYQLELTRAENEKALFPSRRRQLVARAERVEQELLVPAQLDLMRTDVAAPWPGAIVELSVEAGQSVRAGDKLAVVTDLSVVQIPVAVSMEDYAKIEPAVRTARSRDELPRVLIAENETASAWRGGRVVRVAPTADQLTRTVNVYVEIRNNDAALSPGASQIRILPGMFVHARIDGPVLHDALAIPRDAILGERVFVVDKDGRIEVRTVRVRRTLQTLAIIDSGLKAGDRVVLTNLDVIHAGAKVAVQARRHIDEELQEQRIAVARKYVAGANGRAKENRGVN